ncbi:hypothetical protein D3C85_984760 [compost metagenome]
MYTKPNEVTFAVGLIPLFKKILCCVGGLLAALMVKLPSFLIRNTASTSLPTLSLPKSMMVKSFTLLRSTIPALIIRRSLKNLNDALASLNERTLRSTKFKFKEESTLLNWLNTSSVAVLVAVELNWFPIDWPPFPGAKLLLIIKLKACKFRLFWSLK